MITTRKYGTADDRIRKAVAVLDIYWYKRKKAAFTKQCAPDEDYFIEDNTPDGYEEYMQTLTEEERAGSTHYYGVQITIDNYCYLEDYAQSGESGESVAGKLIVIIERTAEGQQNPTTLKLLLSHVEAVIKEYLNEVSIEAGIAEYEEVLLYFQKKCDDKIHNHFYDRITNLELLELLSSLPQEEQEQLKPLPVNDTIKTIPLPKVEQEYLDDVVEVLNPFFEEHERAMLRKLLQTGEGVKEKLLFKRTGSALCFFFKQLLINRIIVIQSKTLLNDWLSGHFDIWHNGKRGELTAKYASRYISENTAVPKTNQLAKFTTDEKHVRIEPTKSPSRQRNFNS